MDVRPTALQIWSAEDLNAASGDDDGESYPRRNTPRSTDELSESDVRDVTTAEASGECANGDDGGTRSAFKRSKKRMVCAEGEYVDG